MTKKVVSAIAFAWILSLVSVAVWAQSRTPGPTIIQTGQPFGDVITGENIGFQRIAATSMTDNHKIVGKWMVKIDGKWVETQTPVGIVR
jgi:hypothetical protein